MMDQEEIRLRGIHRKARHLLDCFCQPLALGDDHLDTRHILMTHLINDVGRDDRKRIHVIRHERSADHVRHGSRRDAIADACRRETVCLRERPRDDHVRIILEQRDCRLPVELHIRLIDEERATRRDVIRDVLDVRNGKACARRIVRIADDAEARFVFDDS